MIRAGIRAIAPIGAPGLSCFAWNPLRGFHPLGFNPLSRVLRDGGSSFEDGQRIARRKSMWMVLWLRARRDGDSLRAFYRRRHFAEKRG